MKIRKNPAGPIEGKMSKIINENTNPARIWNFGNMLYTK